jgi:hypothetical protein
LRHALYGVEKPSGFFRLHLVAQQVDVPADNHEQIVQIVGDAASHAGNGFRFLARRR